MPTTEVLASRVKKLKQLFSRHEESIIVQVLQVFSMWRASQHSV